MWIKLLLIIAFLWGLQSILAYFQVKDLHRNVMELQKYPKVGIGQNKGFFGPGTIIIIAIDSKGRIKKAKKMEGISVFARFRTVNTLTNLYVNELKYVLNDLNKPLKNAILEAVESMKENKQNYRGDN